MCDKLTPDELFIMSAGKPTTFFNLLVLELLITVVCFFSGSNQQLEGYAKTTYVNQLENIEACDEMHGWNARKLSNEEKRHRNELIIQSVPGINESNTISGYNTVLSYVFTLPGAR